MNYTTNFNLIKPEGTDNYNHLTIDNPNMDTIDSVMYSNRLASVGAATELVSGTIHAITRADSNQNIFKFKATGNFNAGDTITVDGVTVNAFTTSGQPLLNNAYVLSAEVLCVLDGSSLWVLVNKTPEASEVKYDNDFNVKSKIEDAITWITSSPYSLIDNTDVTITLSKDESKCNEFTFVLATSGNIRYTYSIPRPLFTTGGFFDFELASMRLYFKYEKIDERTIKLSLVTTGGMANPTVWLAYR